MTKITESSIETFAIELLEKQGYRYIYGPDITHVQEMPFYSKYPCFSTNAEVIREVHFPARSIL